MEIGPRITVREASLADAAAIARVHVESWRTTYRAILPADYLASLSVAQRRQLWEAVLGHPAGGTFAYVAENEAGRVIGFASGGPALAPDPDYQGELSAIYLLAEYQRYGRGRRLVRSVAERLTRAGLRSMLVRVLEANPACRFYERCGGRRVRVEPIQEGGVTLNEVTYGWPDVAESLRVAHHDDVS